MNRKSIFLLLFGLTMLALAACGGAAAVTPEATLVEVTPLPTATDVPPTVEPEPTEAPPTATALPPTEAPPTATPALSLTERMDAFVQAETDAGRFSGAVLVYHDGELLFSEGYGLADSAAGTPITPSTRFPLGTLTMPFTAVAVLQLMDQGKLALDDPICNYLDDCPAGWAEVQIRHLLAQSSGITGEDVARAYAIATDDSEPAATALQAYSESELYFAPGSQWPGLTPSDFVLLGLVIEKASGQSYADFLADNIFNPLGMADTGLTNDTDQMALGSFGASAAPNNLVDYYAGRGLSSNLEDMARFSEALLAGDLLSPEATEQMVDRVVSMSSGWYTGLGWFMSNFDGRFYSASMPGLGIRGYNGAMVILPEEDLAWVILSNASNQEQGYGGDALTLMVLDGEE